MSYNNPNRIKYQVTFDAGNNGNESWAFTGPKGKKGRLWDYGIEAITEVYTSGGSIAIGTAADPDAYGDEFPTTAAAGATADVGTHSVRSLYAETDAGFSTYMLEQELPADTAFVMTCVDDAASGIATYFVIVDWAD